MPIDFCSICIYTKKVFYLQYVYIPTYVTPTNLDFQPIRVSRCHNSHNSLICINLVV